MDEDTQNIVIGVCSALGGFILLIILLCIIWRLCCGSLCKEEPSHRQRNNLEHKQNVNLKRAQEMLEKNRLKKKLAEQMKNEKQFTTRQEIYQYDQ